MRTIHILAACWLLSLVIAVMATLVFASALAPVVVPGDVVMKPVEVEEPALEILPAGLDTDGPVRLKPGRTRDLSEEVSHLDAPREQANDAVSMSSLEFREALASALRSKNLVGMNLVMAHLIANLTPDNIHDALREFESASRSHSNDSSFCLLMHVWGQIDPVAALGYLNQQKTGREVHGATHMVMLAWSEQSPEDALDYVNSLPQKQKEFLWRGLMHGWVRSDQSGAADYARNVQDTQHRKNLINTIAQFTIKDHGGQAALNWLDQTTREFGETDPGFAGEVFRQVFSNIRPEQAPEAAAWIDQNPDHPKLNDSVFQRVARFFVQQDPNSAVAWLEAYRSSGSEHYNHEAIGKFAGAWARNDPHAALVWAENMQEPSHQSSAYAQIASLWDGNDLKSAEAWLEEGRDDPPRDGARRRYSTRIVMEDPLRALEYGSQIQNKSYREESMVNAARVLYQHDPEAVVNWLPVSGLRQDAQDEILKPPQPWAR